MKQPLLSFRHVNIVFRVAYSANAEALILAFLITLIMRFSVGVIFFLFASTSCFQYAFLFNNISRYLVDETLKQALYNQKVHAVAKPSETTRALISCFIYSKHGHEIYLHEIEGFQYNVGYFFHNKSY